MFVPTPATSIIAFRVREKMRRDIEREAQQRKLAISEEVRRRLKFYADCHADRRCEKPRQVGSAIARLDSAISK